MSWPRSNVLSANDISNWFSERAAAFKGRACDLGQQSASAGARPCPTGSHSSCFRCTGSIATYLLFIALSCFVCDQPHTYVVLENNYSRSTAPLVVYHAFWQAVSFQTPVPPESSSDPQDTIPASANTAYAVLAPGWDITSSTAPTSLIAIQSRHGFEVHLNNTLHIPVDDTTFVGNCAAGSFLTQEQADFITQRVFASDFEGLSYDATTCTTSGGP